MRADVVLLTALSKELEAIVDSRHGLTWVKVPSNRTIRTYYVTTLGNLRVAAVQTSGMGQLRAFRMS